ncbi:MAG: hypothetical protein NXI21_19015 [Alphaproteobacteria bacterium]|nr:hypothetical protein [Alphaproteobacteria bacterium]
MTPRLAPRPLALALTAGALLLAACSGGSDLAVRCPDIRIPQDTERLTRFRPGEGRDITDVRLEAEVAFLSGECEVEDDAIEMRFPVAVAGQRGPANEDGVSDVTLFVAVARPDRTILSRRELPLRLTFPGNKVRVIAREPLSIEIPKQETEGARDFLVFLGFALSREELAYNRAEESLR